MKYVFLILFLIVGVILLNNGSINYMGDIIGMSEEEVNTYCKTNNLKCSISYENSINEKGSVISQSILNGEVIKKNSNVNIVISKGIDVSLYEQYCVNELGRVPIMMYHGIHNLNNSDTNYIGGNVDRNGYQRTVEAFKNDLEFYYNSGYRMVRLIDYINGIIDVPLGLSPIVLTFDDGLKNNFNVLGLDENGDLIIDESSAVGILENFKNKYPDFNVTATFFLNGSLFEQDLYNDKIINWLIEHNYDIGNHSYNHVDFSKISTLDTMNEISSMYQKLNSIIGNKYINVVALPFGSPYKIEHDNFKYILNGDDYNTISTLRVGWESDYSPFSVNFDKTFIKRIRAYDNNGTNFDIEYNFMLLESSKYISDGNKDTITFPKKYQNEFNNFSSNTIVY